MMGVGDRIRFSRRERRDPVTGRNCAQLTSGSGYTYPLYFFGPMVETYLTSRQYGVYYLLCGVGGAILYVLALPAGSLYSTGSTSSCG